MYKLPDILEHIWEEIKLGCANHLFLLSFIFFVVFVGTLGIWFTPFYGDRAISFKDAFDKVGMLSYCVPLLSVTIFDASLRALIKIQRKDDAAESSLYAWGVFFTILLVFLVVVSIANAPRDVFSGWSLLAGVLSLFYWFVVNASNDAYRKPVNNSSPSGKSLDNSSELLDGRK